MARDLALGRRVTGLEIRARERGVSSGNTPSLNRTNLQQLLTEVATTGGHVVFDEPVRVSGTILVSDPVAPFMVEWRGPNAWLEADFATNQNLIEIRRATKPITFLNCRINARYDPSAANGTAFGGHGLTLYKCSNFHAQGRTDIRNWKNSAVSTYTDNADPAIGQYTNNVFDQVYCISERKEANNGFILVNMRNSGAHFVYVDGVTGSPGAAIGIKNRNKYCFIGRYFVQDSRDAVTFGQDQGDGSDYCSVGQGQVVRCRAALTFGPGADHNQVGFMTVDCDGRIDVEYPHRNEGGRYNVVEGLHIANLPASKSAVWLWSPAVGNKVKISGVFNTGAYATVDGTYNQITIEADLDETAGLSLSNRIIDRSGGDTNTYALSQSLRGPQWIVGRHAVTTI
jgi:hypothetical protein